MNQQILIATDLLKQGELVAFPTDTLYGLGADATNEQAILKVFARKNRSLDSPLIVHIPNIEHIGLWADLENLDLNIHKILFKLVNKFWPGPLTIVLKKAATVSNLITAGQDSIGLRIPNHPLALDLLKSFNSGIVGTSANKSGGLNPVSSTQVKTEFNNNVFVLGDDVCKLGVESTIISLINTDRPQILRQGAVNWDQITSCLV